MDCWSLGEFSNINPIVYQHQHIESGRRREKPMMVYGTYFSNIKSDLFETI